MVTDRRATHSGCALPPNDKRLQGAPDARKRYAGSAPACGQAADKAAGVPGDRLPTDSGRNAQDGRQIAGARPVPADRVSVVIPILNAAPHLEHLLAALQRQHPVSPGEIILADSGSTDDSLAIAARFAHTRSIPIAEFSHGRSRNLGARSAAGDIVVFLSQDALPRDSHWLEELLRPFSDPQTVAAYSRQVPWPDALFAEKFFLETRFPAAPPVRRKKTSNTELTLEDVFFSNVSSAIRRSILLRFPFDEMLIMSEDQQFSRDVLNAGYAVAYAPDSVVIHSHTYTLRDVFRRYFDSVYSLTQIFPAHGL